jgi:pullulanase/glycogen debranching enzyme
VFLDVVFNHTAEGTENGPTLCLRGLDNAGYYRLVPGDLAHYFDTTGTGNSLDLGHPDCLRLVMDSLRFWITEYRIDGYRFDLAPTLARQDGTCCRAACPCCSVGTSSVAPRAATTTRTARTTRSPGTTGPLWTRSCWSSPGG